MDNYIYLLFVTEIIFVIISYYVTKKNLLSPSFNTYIMFSLATVCVIYNIDFWDVSYSFKTYLVILLGFIAMIIPEIIIVGFKSASLEKRIHGIGLHKAYHYEMPQGIDKILVILSIVSAIVMVVDVFYFTRYGTSEGLFVIGLIKNSEEGLSLISRIANRTNWILIIVYSYMLTYNIAIKNQSILSNKLKIVPLLMGIITILLSGNRVAPIKMLGILYVFYLSMKLKNSNKKISPFYVAKKFFGIGVAIILSFYSLRAITKVNSTAAQREFIDYITYYIGSPVYLLDKYLLSFNELYYYNNPFGTMSFSSIYTFLGVDIDYYNYYIYLGGYSGFAGNEFSWFQRPYADFGFFGMLIFTVLFYAVFDYILYFKINRRNNNLIYVIIYAYFFYIFLMSFYYCQTAFMFSPYNILYIGMAYLIISKLTKKKDILEKNE